MASSTVTSCWLYYFDVLAIFWCKLSLSPMIHYWYLYSVDTCMTKLHSQSNGAARVMMGIWHVKISWKAMSSTRVTMLLNFLSTSLHWFSILILVRMLWWWTPSILYRLILKVINLEKPHHADSAQHRCQINQSGRIRPTKELFVMDLRRSESPITDHHGHQHHHRYWPNNTGKRTACDASVSILGWLMW